MYKFRIEEKRIPVKINSNLSLYDACKRTIGVKGGIVIMSTDKVHFRLVAFYCSYYRIVKAGFGATPYERSQIENFALGA